jgi:hypothetical protein
MSKSATNAEGDGQSRLLGIVEVPERDEVAELAYQLWVKRGCPDGSADEDWLRAEEDLLHGRALHRRA